MNRRRLWFLLAALPVIALAILTAQSCRAPALGVVEGQLTPCPDSPNCVCSHDTSESARIEPLPWTGEVDSTRECLLDAAETIPRCDLYESRDDYLRFVVTSALLRFKDDLEFLISPADRCVHVRSASRVGYSDLGVNRERVEQFRKAYHERLEALGQRRPETPAGAGSSSDEEK